MAKWISRGIATVVTVLIGVWINYLAMPAWNIRSVGIWIFLAVVAGIATGTFWIAESITEERGGFKEHICGNISGICAATILLGMIVCRFSSSHLFNADDYHNMIEIEEGNFEEDIPKVSQDMQLSIVDLATAKDLGDRTVGNLDNSVWYEVGNEYNLIKYTEKYYRISELQYGSIFKYAKAKYQGIPGYVLVDTTT